MPRRVTSTPEVDPSPEGDEHVAHVAVRFPPGHFYSPLVDTNALATEHRRSQVWPPVPRETPGIDWRADEQRRLCRALRLRPFRRLWMKPGCGRTPPACCGPGRHKW